MHYGKPAEGAWANMKNGLGNLAARNVDELAAVMKSRLKRIQYPARPHRGGSSLRPGSPSNPSRCGEVQMLALQPLYQRC